MGVGGGGQTGRQAETEKSNTDSRDRDSERQVDREKGRERRGRREREKGGRDWGERGGGGGERWSEGLKREFTEVHW